MEAAFRILDAIARGDSVDLFQDGRWIDALLTIRWVSEGGSGHLLTDEGRRAHLALAAEFRSPRQTNEPA